mmetsp:Transcript_26377/g.83586  ORF Transcript_26377/g.83586 Transcript_26377/m.83586 type:complete len:261 (-) Transcript_26377:616-1398(-)
MQQLQQMQQQSPLAHGQQSQQMTQPLSSQPPPSQQQSYQSFLQAQQATVQAQGSQNNMQQQQQQQHVMGISMVMPPGQYVNMRPAAMGAGMRGAYVPMGQGSYCQPGQMYTSPGQPPGGGRGMPPRASMSGVVPIGGGFQSGAAPAPPKKPASRAIAIVDPTTQKEVELPNKPRSQAKSEQADAPTVADAPPPPPPPPPPTRPPQPSAPGPSTSRRTWLMLCTQTTPIGTTRPTGRSWAPASCSSTTRTSATPPTPSPPH